MSLTRHGASGHILQFVDVGLLLIFTGVLSRLVEGISLSRRLSETCFAGTGYAPSMHQHEQ